MNDQIELKPCPCGNKQLRFDCEVERGEWGVSISCMNMFCDRIPLMSFAKAKEEALKIAVENWNRRADNEQRDKDIM